jgi:2-oxoglutarate ferredoxin oxidoreductase subunit gamma
MSSRYSVRVAGFGGQGVITFGYVLARAASLHHGSNALMTQSYGPEARGGSCRSDVILSETPIDYPKAGSVDALVALSYDSYNSFSESVKEGGVIIYEKDLVEINEKRERVSYHGIPAIETAKKLGNILAANMVMLGAVQAITGQVTLDALRLSIKDRFPRFVDLNIKALEEGVRLGARSRE